MRALGIEGAWVLEPKVFPDDRGSFHEWYRGEEFREATGYDLELAQANCSVSRRGAIQGWQADYRVTFDCQERKRLSNRSDAESRCRCRDFTWIGSLRCHGIRCGLFARQICQRTGQGSDPDRTS